VGFWINFYLVGGEIFSSKLRGDIGRYTSNMENHRKQFKVGKESDPMKILIGRQ
jgi:hypothetical protein